MKGSSVVRTQTEHKTVGGKNQFSTGCQQEGKQVLYSYDALKPTVILEKWKQLQVPIKSIHIITVLFVLFLIFLIFCFLLS